jgi:hypothetical protein
MTKTNAALAAVNFPDPRLAKMMSFGTEAGRAALWDFVYGSLEFVWILVLAIWKLKNGKTYKLFNCR